MWLVLVMGTVAALAAATRPDATVLSVRPEVTRSQDDRTRWSTAATQGREP